MTVILSTPPLARQVIGIHFVGGVSDADCGRNSSAPAKLWHNETHVAPRVLARLRIMAKHPAIHRLIAQLLGWLPNIEPVVLVVLAVGTASLWGFIEIAEEVFEGDTQAFDHWVVRALRDPINSADPIGPRWVEEMARDITALGGLAWITFSTVVIAGYLWLDGKTHMSLFLVAATAGGAVVSMLLKSLFARPRPDLVPHLSHVYTSSFPSGHSMLAAVVYLTLGSLLASVISNLKLKIYVLSVAILLTIAVGLSRIYLGVHYPTDVLGGWLAGLVWALLCWLVARWLQRRGQVEKPSDSNPKPSPKAP